MRLVVSPATGKRTVQGSGRNPVSTLLRDHVFFTVPFSVFFTGPLLAGAHSFVLYQNAPDMKARIKLFHTAILVVLCALAILTGCGSGTGPSETEQATAIDSTPVVDGSQRTNSALAPGRMSLLASEWKKMTDEFPLHYRLKGGSAIKDTQVEIPWSAIDDRMQRVSGTQRAVLFHYGLKDGSFRLGLSFVKLDDISGNGTEYEYPDHDKVSVHPFENGAFLGPMSYPDWEKNYVSAPLPTTGRYFDRVELRRTDAPAYEKVVFGTDPQFEIMPYELEILRLYNENSGAYGSDTVYLVVTCASDYDTAEKSFAHNLCLHIRTRSGGSGGSATDLLDESARIDSFEFKMHGGDLGNLCPPKCKKYATRHAIL